MNHPARRLAGVLLVVLVASACGSRVDRSDLEAANGPVNLAGSARAAANAPVAGPAMAAVTGTDPSAGPVAAQPANTAPAG
ncbi:MAG: hypothetical protein ACRDZ3_11565, partial [Acidimicrobiia bacterium]